MKKGIFAALIMGLVVTVSCEKEDLAQTEKEESKQEISLLISDTFESIEDFAESAAAEGESALYEAEVTGDPHGVQIWKNADGTYQHGDAFNVAGSSILSQPEFCVCPDLYITGVSSSDYFDYASCGFWVVFDNGEAHWFNC